MSKWKILAIVLGSLLAIFMVYFLIDYGSGGDILKQYESVKPDNTSGFSKSLQFVQAYTYLTKDTSIAKAMGFSDDDVEDMLNNNYGPQPPSDDNDYDPNQSHDTQAILAMSDEEFWKLISEGTCSSYDEFNSRCNADPDGEKTKWTGMLTRITVPCWKWQDGAPVSSTYSLQVNKYVATFWTDFFNDLYDLPEQYCIVEAGGFNFRKKNNGSSNPSWSSHGLGTTVDINWSVDGMGSYAASGSQAGIPYASYDGLSEELKHKVCAQNGSWIELAKAYHLDWGGFWSHDSLDPMHFSMVGDSHKWGSAPTSPKYTGR